MANVVKKVFGVCSLLIRANNGVASFRTGHNPTIVRPKPNRPLSILSMNHPRSGLEGWRIRPDLELNHRYEKTLAKVLEHPPNLNVHWKEVTHLLENGLGARLEHSRTGPLKAFLDGEMIGTFRTRHSYLHKKDIANVRSMLERSGVVTHAEQRDTDRFTDPNFEEPDRFQELDADGQHVVCFVDHHEARIFDGAAKGTHEAVKLHPYYPDSSNKNFQHGVLHEEDREYYHAIIDAVKDRDEIVLAGITTIEKRSAMQFLLEEMEKKYSDDGIRVRDKVVGTIYVDKHVTDPQMLAKARELYNEIHPVE